MVLFLFKGWLFTFCCACLNVWYLIVGGCRFCWSMLLASVVLLFDVLHWLVLVCVG